MLIVDRIEGEYAVCESDEGRMNVPLSRICGKVKEGDILAEKNGGYIPDCAAAERRRRDIWEKEKGLWE